MRKPACLRTRSRKHALAPPLPHSDGKFPKSLTEALDASATSASAGDNVPTATAAAAKNKPIGGSSKRQAAPAQAGGIASPKKGKGVARTHHRRRAVMMMVLNGNGSGPVGEPAGDDGVTGGETGAGDGGRGEEDSGGEGEDEDLLTSLLPPRYWRSVFF